MGGTRKGCDHYGVPERFDERLTRRWATVISSAATDRPASENFEEFIARNPQNSGAEIGSGSPMRARRATDRLRLSASASRRVKRHTRTLGHLNETASEHQCSGLRRPSPVETGVSALELSALLARRRPEEGYAGRLTPAHSRS